MSRDAHLDVVAKAIIEPKGESAHFIVRCELCGNVHHVRTAVRADRYEIPTDPDLRVARVRDQQRENDLFVNASSVSTLSRSSLLTIAPFLHVNTATLTRRFIPSSSGTTSSNRSPFRRAAAAAPRAEARQSTREASVSE